MNQKDILPWIEKYAPTVIEEIYQRKKIKHFINNCIKRRNISHCLFFGSPGSGKTKTIEIIASYFYGKRFDEKGNLNSVNFDRFLVFNASTVSEAKGINDIKDKVTKEARKSTFSVPIDNNLLPFNVQNSEIVRCPPFKIIVINEADNMTSEAQEALRVPIEEYSKICRFVFICSFKDKIASAIASRCFPLRFDKIDDNDIVKKCRIICNLENLNLTNEQLMKIAINSSGDMRKAINTLQGMWYLSKVNIIKNSNILTLNPKESKIRSLIDEYTSSVIEDDNNIEKNIDFFYGKMSEQQTSLLLQEIFTTKTIKGIKSNIEKILATGLDCVQIINQLRNEYENVYRGQKELFDINPNIIDIDVENKMNITNELRRDKEKYSKFSKDCVKAIYKLKKGTDEFIVLLHLFVSLHS